MITISSEILRTHVLYHFKKQKQKQIKQIKNLKINQSYLHNRTQCVIPHGCYCSKESVKCGAPQGSVLEPVLFSLFSNDLPLQVKNISVDCDMLADDTRLHTSGKDILQIRISLQDGRASDVYWGAYTRPIPVSTESRWGCF